MSAAVSRLSDSEALLRALTCLLHSVSDGYWSDFSEDWDPIITCITCELLLSCGMSEDTPWFVKRGGYIRYTLQDTFAWLDRCIKDDGRFGTDFWDAARLGLLVERHSLHRYFPSYVRLKSYLLGAIGRNTILSGPSPWTGPGFLAVAVDYLDHLGHRVDADALLERLTKNQAEDGSWQGVVDSQNHPVISPVWHSAQAVLTLARRGRTEHRHRISSALNWLRQSQDGAGCWPGTQQYLIYYTAYAILALLQAETPQKHAINRAVEYLKSRITPDGKCSDLGGTLMCALAFKGVADSLTGGHTFEPDLTLMDYLLARTSMTRAEAAEAKLADAERTVDVLREQLAQAEKNTSLEVTTAMRRLVSIVVLATAFVAASSVLGLYAVLYFTTWTGR